MPDLLLHADKGLRGIARTGGTLLGADCSTEKMPAAIRLSRNSLRFVGEATPLNPVQVAMQKEHHAVDSRAVCSCVRCMLQICSWGARASA